MLNIPALRERSGDIDLLVDELLGQINLKCRLTTNWSDKKISVSARKLIRNHSWPGNIRELLNTLVRCAMWTSGDIIREEDVQEALFDPGDYGGVKNAILNRPLGETCDLQTIMQEVAQHYLARALDAAHGNKTKAAELVGLPSYQTLTNWLSKYDVAPHSVTRES